MTEKTTRLLVLSSSSPARRALLARLGIPFVSMSPDIDETPLANEDPQALVLRLAEEKAKIACKTYPSALIIGCDQVGFINGTFLSKPLTHENAVKQLTTVSGQCVPFFTGLCLYDALNEKSQTAIATYTVCFRQLNTEQIENYLQKEKPYQCAGGFQVEGLGISLVDRFEGEDYTALIGLPLIQLASFLAKTALDPLQQA